MPKLQRSCVTGLAKLTALVNPAKNTMHLVIITTIATGGNITARSLCCSTGVIGGGRRMVVSSMGLRSRTILTMHTMGRFTGTTGCLQIR